MSLTFKDQADLLVLTNQVNGTTYDKFGKIVGVDYSSTSLVLGAGTKTLTLEGSNGVDRDYKVDDIVVLTAKAGTTGTMTGKVLLYTPNNRGLLVNVTSFTGSGTGTQFRITKSMPRIDYHPVTKEPRGVHIESAATNFFKNSDDAIGSVISGTLTEAVITTVPSPSGNFSVRRLTVTAEAVYRFSDGVGTSGTPYTGSLFVATAPGLEGALTQANIAASFNSVNSQVWTVNSASFTRILASASTANTLRQLDVTLPVGEYYIWGCQIEADTLRPTSYIPTKSTTEVRNLDLIKTINLNMSGAINALEGTLVVAAEHEVQVEDDNRAYTIAALSDGTLSNIISLQLNNQAAASNAARANVVSAGSNVFSYTTANNVFNLNNKYRFGVAYKENSFYAVFDNTESSVDTLGSVPSSLNTLYIGSSDSTLDIFQGWISEVFYIPLQVSLAELKEIVDSIGNPLLVP